MAKKTSKKKSSGAKVKADALKGLIQRVFLNGAIDSCVLEIDDEGLAEVYAIDVSNVIFLYASEDLGVEEEIEIGLGNLDILNKFLGSIKEPDVTLEFFENRITIKREKFGKLEYLLTSKDLIPTALEEKDEVIERLVNACTIEANLTPEFASTLSSYYGMVKAKEMTFTYANEKLTVGGGSDTGHKYTLQLDCEEIEDSDEDKFTVSVYGDFLLNILNVLDYEESPKIMLAPGSPVVVVQGEEQENVWGIVLVSTEGQSEED